MVFEFDDVDRARRFGRMIRSQKTLAALRKLRHALIAGTLAVVAAAVHAAPVPDEISACGEGDGFPPFTYPSPKDGSATGYHVDMLRAVVASSQRRLRIDLLPWARCVALAARGHYDLIIDVSNTAVRQRDFAMPRHSYLLTSIAVFRRDKPVPPLRTLADLLPLSRCEILGWDYSSAGFPPSEQAAGQPQTIEAAAKMLRAGRCDVLLYDAELLGASALQERPDPLPESEFAYTPLQWVTRIKLFAGVSRAVPYRDELVRLLDAGLARFQGTEADKALRKTYRLPD